MKNLLLISFVLIACTCSHLITQDTIVNKYDDQGNLIEYCKYKSEGRLHDKQTFKYEENSNKIEWNTYIVNGHLKIKETYKYNDKGKRVTTVEYGSNEIIIVE